MRDWFRRLYVVCFCLLKKRTIEFFGGFLHSGLLWLFLFNNWLYWCSFDFRGFDWRLSLRGWCDHRCWCWFRRDNRGGFYRLRFFSFSRLSWRLLKERTLKFFGSGCTGKFNSSKGIFGRVVRRIFLHPVTCINFFRRFLLDNCRSSLSQRFLLQ